MRVYKIGTDSIYVENTNSAGEFMHFENYLNKIQNKYDRAIDKAKIEKLVGW